MTALRDRDSSPVLAPVVQMASMAANSSGVNRMLICVVRFMAIRSTTLLPRAIYFLLDCGRQCYTVGHMATVQLNVRMDEQVVERLEQLARENGMTKSALARMATLQMLKKLRKDAADQPEGAGNE